MSCVTNEMSVVFLFKNTPKSQELNNCVQIYTNKYLTKSTRR
jgi:hypothetical protein